MSIDPPTDTPSANGACHFLRLPGELCNIIYAYSLHEPAGIRYSMKDGRKLLVRGQGGGAESAPDPEANQIKFTCRQLRQETRGLGIRYSDLYFRPFLGHRLLPRQLQRDTLSPSASTSHCERWHFGKLCLYLKSSASVSELPPCHGLGSQPFTGPSHARLPHNCDAS
jgi:hypothetical protein